MLIRASDSVLVVIDMQERLVPAMQAPARTIRNTKTLIAAATEMDVPILLTEQYPKGLGRTVPEIASITEAPVFSKMHFSCMEDEAFGQAFRDLGRKQAVISGMEAHICVVQTAASLIEEDYEVFVVSDATASRTLESEHACIQRLSAIGAGIVTTEMVVFEWLGQAGSDHFKRILPLVK
ncbi:hydrolase [Tepidamorphus sp. 3E244]|uniref:hydrolase n=1 Tax=Tepidamorphus sp. 3E244 TaxID=3385498 RepID=UPI0038FC9A41